MLESMIEQPRPTRAEASDVANAVLDGTDCVMLSGETSVGAWPVEAVQYMDRIIRAIENSEPRAGKGHATPSDRQLNVADAIGKAACVIAEQIDAAAIVTLTRSGGTARIVAKYRPPTPIIALTDNEDTLRTLAFTWGVHAKLIPPLQDLSYDLDNLHAYVLQTGLVSPGMHAVFSCGSPLHKKGTTNMLEVRKV
jgi:pyruvate kinase